MENSMILEETSEFSATHKMTEGTDISSERVSLSKGSL